MQMIDMRIALCHFTLTAEENGLRLDFVQDDPKLALNCDVEYIASYKII